MNTQNSTMNDEELTEKMYDILRKNNMQLSFDGTYTHDMLQLIHEYSESRGQQIALAARLDEWEIVRGNWHGVDDNEFAQLMNERRATLKSQENH